MFQRADRSVAAQSENPGKWDWGWGRIPEGRANGAEDVAPKMVADKKSETYVLTTGMASSVMFQVVVRKDCIPLGHP